MPKTRSFSTSFCLCYFLLIIPVLHRSPPLARPAPPPVFQPLPRYNHANHSLSKNVPPSCSSSFIPSTWTLLSSDGRPKRENIVKFKRPEYSGNAERFEQKREVDCMPQIYPGSVFYRQSELTLTSATAASFSLLPSNEYQLMNKCTGRCRCYDLEVWH